MVTTPPCGPASGCGHRVSSLAQRRMRLTQPRLRNHPRARQQDNASFGVFPPDDLRMHPVVPRRCAASWPRYPCATQASVSVSPVPCGTLRARECTCVPSCALAAVTLTASKCPSGSPPRSHDDRRMYPVVPRRCAASWLRNPCATQASVSVSPVPCGTSCARECTCVPSCALAAVTLTASKCPSGSPPQLHACLCHSWADNDHSVVGSRERCTTQDASVCCPAGPPLEPGFGGRWALPFFAMAC